ncbi:MAG: sarcosine oxidase subunit gamma [Paracoccaceae bacterium]|jgi:sarcosine oxidase subunit gamma
MSDPASALSNARFDGIAMVEETGLQGMITLRGDLSNRVLKTAATGAAGAKMPRPNTANITGDTGLCWMSPDELLILCPYPEVTTRLTTLTDKLGATHTLAVNVSDARAMFRVHGADAREVMAKLAPVDLSPDAFKPGLFRRSRLAQVPAAFWMDDDQTFRIICFRSVATYMFGLLKTAAMPGAEVGYF